MAHYFPPPALFSSGNRTHHPLSILSLQLPRRCGLSVPVCLSDRIPTCHSEPFPAHSPHTQVFSSINIYAQLPQVHLCQFDLAHQLRMRHGDVVESEDASAEFTKEVGSESDEDPEWELFVGKVRRLVTRYAMVDNLLSS